MSPLLHERWFLDVPLDTAMHRTCVRHESTGLTPESAILRIESNDRLNAEMVADTKHNADVCIRAYY